MEIALCNDKLPYYITYAVRRKASRELSRFTLRRFFVLSLSSGLSSLAIVAFGLTNPHRTLASERRAV